LKLKFIDTRMFKYIDWLLFANIMLLVLFSFVAISSAVSDPIPAGSSFTEILSRINMQYAIQQIEWFGIGLVAMFIVLLPDYHAIGEYYKWIYLIIIVLLIAVFAFGTTVHGTRGWFRIGTSGFQPSEVGKTAMVIVLAKMISDKTKSRGGSISGIKDILPVVGVFLLPAALILLERDLGTVLVYAFTFFSMLFIAKTSLKLIFGLFACVGAVLPGAWFLLADWQKLRIYTALGIESPDIDPADLKAAKFQSDAAQAAAGSGQITGKGLFSQLSNIPEKHTDFLFASTTEALGFIGAAIIILLYIVLIVRTLYLAAKAKDEFGTLIIVGVLAMTLFHIFENIGMNLGVMPITGIPLPFLSYGGSNLLTNMIAFGLVLNVGMRRQRWGING